MTGFVELDVAKAERRADELVVLDRNEPLASARAFIRRDYFFECLPILPFWRGIFCVWAKARYQFIEEQRIRAEVYRFLDQAKLRTAAGLLLPFNATKGRVEAVVDALKAEVYLDAEVSPPCWLDYVEDLSPDPVEVLCCQTAIIHLPTMEHQQPTPRFFSFNALPFNYCADAHQPKAWLSFLQDLFSGDTDSIDALQEIFGYLLTSDTRQQKIFLIVGPPRAGKGVIGRVLTDLLGSGNVCAPTLSSLTQNFGLAPLIGKIAAIVSDARLGGRVDQQTITERLLSISGEDNITIDRKFLAPWTGRLTTRFLILTNELPRLADASGALARRFIVLRLTRSFYGREDHNLTDRLLAELPSILIWAIEGWHRLQERGFFEQPGSASDAIEDLQDLASPISAFVRDRCFAAAGAEIRCTELYAAWCVWCELQGRRHPGTVQSFGRDLRAAVPSITTRNLAGPSGGRARHFTGIRLQP